ncbi:MAG TPA: nucleotidyltransferase family protein [Vicinamibacteria bacterium]|nr:nucleotidyltransferase family protein [Vicinamibacteria bacterium]
MSRDPFRFRPPPHATAAEERWCLLRAFAPRETAAPAVAAAAAVGVARALGLAARIAGRLGPAALQRELGEESARALLHDYASALGRAQALDRAARAVAQAAAEVGAPLVLLKGAALSALRLVDDAQREAVDVDALVPEDRLEALQDRLVARGFRASDARPADHQAAPLTDPSGAMVELHRFVPGLRAAGSRRDARLADLERAGGLEPLAGWPGRVLAPARDVLAAHALVHGLDQHGLSPGSYPLARMLGDLADLEAGGFALLWSTVERWIGGSLSRAEAEAAFQLTGDLRRGGLPSSPHADALLRHVLVAAADPGYGASLGQRALIAQLTSGAPGDRSRLLASVLFPTRAQLDALYGGPRSALGYVLLRLWRPFELGLRLALYLLRG